ncbi:hypothetical protein LWM68_01845 [Niabella sp. W65]|nr:hypothetical protein [Niabella sp. W65]MCH7361638.1 hypothetical protein [Niabella sp. W65]ULT45417.1 hypothetical protein KRR40_20360 [Niabella sp. I65]
MNNSGKISDLEHIRISNDGTIHKGQPIKAQDKRIDFMPKYGKQTGPTELIVPYSYKRNISFAKVEL